MRRRPIIIFLALVLAFLFGRAVPAYTSVSAQAVTPASWTSIAGPFFFRYHYPAMLGWADAEDKTGDPFVKGYKVDVDKIRANCLKWQVTAGTVPGADLTMDPLCIGGTYLAGGIYWFPMPVVGVTTPSPTGPPPFTPTATVSPSPFPSPSVTGTPGPTGTPTPTPAPIGTPTVLYGNMCRPDPTPEYPHSITIYGQDGLTTSTMFWWCQANVTPDLVIIVPVATFQAAYDDGPRQLLQSLGR